MCGGCRRLHVVGRAAVFAALLLGPFVGPPAGAQSSVEGQAPRPAGKATRAAKAVKPHAPGSRTVTADPTGAKAPGPPQRAKPLDPAKVDPMALDSASAMQCDPKVLDARTPNAWIAVGLVEGRGGNLNGSEESFQHAMALGEQRRNKAAVAAAALHLGRIYGVRLIFLRGQAQHVAMFGSQSNDGLADSLHREFDKAKALIEKALEIHKGLGRKDAMATDYARLGDLHSTAKDFDQAQAAIEQALALNKAVQRKREMAANYRALAETHRYDLDQAETLLKEAVTLHESLGLNEELATDYTKLAENNLTRGEPYEAEKLYKQALALAAKGDQSDILRALVRLYRDRNDPGRAAEMEEQARTLDAEIRKDNGGDMILISPRLGLFVSHTAAKAQLEALEKLVPMEKKMRHWTGLATTYTLLGLHYGQRAGTYADRQAEFEGRAEAMFRESVALNITLKREPALAHAYRELALILNKRGNTSEIQAMLKDALPLHRKLGEGDDMANLYFMLGRGSKARGDGAQACAFWRAGALEYPDYRLLVDSLNNNKCAAAQ